MAISALINARRRRRPSRRAGPRIVSRPILQLDGTIPARPLASGSLPRVGLHELAVLAPTPNDFPIAAPGVWAKNRKHDEQSSPRAVTRWRLTGETWLRRPGLISLGLNQKPNVSTTFPRSGSHH